MGNTTDTNRLHPETIHTLRQLVRLHGAEKLIAAIQEIEKELYHAVSPTRDERVTRRG